MIIFFRARVTHTRNKKSVQQISIAGDIFSTSGRDHRGHEKICSTLTEAVLSITGTKRQRVYVLSRCHAEEATLFPESTILSSVALTKPIFHPPALTSLWQSPLAMAQEHVLLLPSVFPPESHRLRRESHGADSSRLPCLPNLPGHKCRDGVCGGRKGEAGRESHWMCHFAKNSTWMVLTSTGFRINSATDGASAVR